MVGFANLSIFYEESDIFELNEFCLSGSRHGGILTALHAEEQRYNNELAENFG